MVYVKTERFGCLPICLSVCLSVCLCRFSSQSTKWIWTKIGMDLPLDPGDVLQILFWDEPPPLGIILEKLKYLKLFLIAENKIIQKFKCKYYDEWKQLYVEKTVSKGQNFEAMVWVGKIFKLEL